MFTLLYGGSSKLVPKKYAPHRERLGLHVWLLYIPHLPQKSMLCGTAKRIFQRQTTKSRVAVNTEDRCQNGSNQSPVPGFGEKCCSLPSTPSHSLASAGASRFTVILGQLLAYSALRLSHFSRPGSVSGLIASTGHSGSQTPQSMHSSGWMTSMFSPSKKQSTGHTSTQSMVLQRMQLSLTT